MKLVYVANVRIPTEKAHGIQIMKMCEAFANEGIEVELVIPRRFNAIKHDPFEYHSVAPKFKIKRLFTIDPTSLSSLGYYLQFASFVVSLNLFLLSKKIRKEKEVVVYVRGEPILFLQTVARLLYPVFWETHIKPPRHLDFYLSAMRPLRGIVTATRYYEQELREQYKVKPHIFNAPDGVDLGQLEVSETVGQAREQLGLPLDKKIILYSGSFYLYDYKGVDVLIETAAQLPDNYLAVLVGGSPQDIEWIKKSGANLDRVKLIAHVQHRIIPHYLRAADVLVLPNKRGNEISEKYTSPLKLFEYMASGKPIVASDLISLKEILNDRSAYFFQASDVGALRDAIVKAVESEGGENRAMVALVEVAKYTWQKRAAGIIGFIKQNIYERA